MAELTVVPRKGLVDPSSASAEPFRTLKLALEFPVSDRRSSVLLFTSAEPVEGKSTIAANYALVTALGHRRVLLIDGDMRRPALHEFFGLPRSPGLVDVVAEGLQLEEVVRPVSGFETLDVLTAGAAIRRSADLAASPRMAQILELAMRTYSLVVIDSPPLLSAADAPGFASLPGVEVVLVVNKGTRRRLIRRAVHKLELLEARLAGTVMNREGRLSA